MLRNYIFTFAAVIAVACTATKAPKTVKNEPEMLVVESPNLKCNDTVLVYSPQGDAAVRDIPTAFLLHGYSDNYTSWSNHMDLQAFSDSTGFRIICPDGFYKSWYVNDADPDKMQWRTFFWDELWPLIDDKYGLKADRTFITGLSMGGQGSINIFLDHPERFRGAGSMSGVLNLAHAGSLDKGIAEILGAKDSKDPKYTCQSACNRLGRIAEAAVEYGFDPDDKIIVITSGEFDKTYMQGSIDTELKCRELGLRYIYMMSPEKHTWPYWTWVINYHFDWFQQILDGGKYNNPKK